MRTTNLTTGWYTTAFISQALRTYLEDYNYRIQDEPEEHTSNSDELIIASKFLGKEYIEIRGTIETGEAMREAEGNKRMKLMTAVQWLSDVLLSPITFFANNNDEKNRSLCLPDLEQYRDLLEKLKDYFVTNNLSMKVYLVNESGHVRITYLNPLAGREEDTEYEEK